MQVKKSLRFGDTSSKDFAQDFQQPQQPWDWKPPERMRTHRPTNEGWQKLLNL